MPQMSRTSRWAGYVSSVGAIALLLTVTLSYRSGQTLLDWSPRVTAVCMLLAAFSGVVCLVSGIGNFLRNRRRQRHAGLEVSSRLLKS
jgi:hypothetical protein